MLLDIDRSLQGHTSQQLATHAGMAHFAGTGPAGATCGACVHHAHIGSIRNFGCRKAWSMGTRSKQNIPTSTSACRHFETRAPA